MFSKISFYQSLTCGQGSKIGLLRLTAPRSPDLLRFLACFDFGLGKFFLLKIICGIWNVRTLHTSHQSPCQRSQTHLPLRIRRPRFLCLDRPPQLDAW